MKRSIFWFRKDLRLYDNPPLLRAVAESESVLLLYIATPDIYRTNPYGFKCTGNFRAKFLQESIDELSSLIAIKGGELTIRNGRPETIIPELCATHDIDKVYFASEPGVWEKHTEDRLLEALAHINVAVHTEDSCTLTDLTKLPFNISELPHVFTDFRLAVEHLPVPSCTPAPVYLSCIRNTSGIRIKSEQLKVSANALHRSKFNRFAGGEWQGLKRMKQYLSPDGPALSYYDTRNNLWGTDTASGLSPWLAAGCISARTVHHEILRLESIAGGNKSTYWLRYELLWRDFFRLNMEKHGYKMFIESGIKGTKRTFKNDTKLLHLWINGQTEEPLVNACMNELRHTGYLSNRGRQIVASYLINDMGVNWLMGAAWFESQLTDYDVSSNYGNWAYLAGVGNDPRKNRYFSIARQTEQYDADGTYRELWRSRTSGQVLQSTIGN